jgi:hypothetical protein
MEGRISFGPFVTKWSCGGYEHHPAGAASYLNAITESEDVLLHGKGGPGRVVALFPQHAFDASSAFGNESGVYATTSGTEAIFRAMYNKPFARYIAAVAGDIELAGFTQISQRKHKEVYEFRFMPFIFKLLQSGFPNILRDGSVYALLRGEGFERHPERPKEWRTDEWVKPMARFAIKQSELGDHYLRNSVPVYYSRPYTSEELERFRATTIARGRMPQLGNPEFDDFRELIPPAVIRMVLEEETSACT